MVYCYFCLCISFHWVQCLFRGSSSFTHTHVCFVLARSPSSVRWSLKHYYLHYYPRPPRLQCNLSATFHIVHTLLMLIAIAHSTPNHSRGARELDISRAETCNNIMQWKQHQRPHGKQTVHSRYSPLELLFMFYSTEAERNSWWVVLTLRIKEDWSLHSGIWRRIKGIVVWGV